MKQSRNSNNLVS